MNISIIVPNFNGNNLLKENLPKIIRAIVFCQKKIKISAEIIIVDDKSTENSIEEIKKYTDQINIKNILFKISENEKNLGFASTINRGVKNSNGEIIILLNTDVAPHEDFLPFLIQHFKDEKFFAVGCLDESIENGKTILRGRGIGKWEKGFLRHARGEVNNINTLWVSGGSGAFRKKIWDKLGGFNEIFSPFYWEDIDLSYRAQKSGYDILFEPKSRVVHKHEEGSIKKNYSSSRIKTIAYRNQFIFVWSNITDLNYIFSHVYWLPHHFIKAIVKKDVAFLIGFFSAFILLPKIIKFSLNAKKLFSKKDAEIIQNFKK